jgi:exodeoxyribonuclease VII large subunit
MSLQLFPSETSRPRTVTLVRLSGEIARAAATVGRIAVEGEVYRPNRTGGGRIYFTLRDRAAQITVMCPPSKVRRCRTVAGERVCVVGALNWVNERGQMQLIAEEVTPVGDGAVAAMIAEARRRLEADGLLDRPRRPVPALPAWIGVVCGNDAAVRKDIESVIAVRFPGYPVRFAETAVSGPAAALSIVDAMRGLAAEPGVDVIILARGGGDATQLLPFSDEELCRAVCASPVPVVSAIGHDGDRPLCDDVADLRSGTPSLAAAAVIPDRAALFADLSARRDAAKSAALVHLERAERRLGAIDTRKAAQDGVVLAATRLSRAADRLSLLHPRRQLAEATRRLERLDRHAPVDRVLTRSHARLGSIGWRRPVTERWARSSDHLAATARHLHALAPARVLERGYAVVRIRGGAVVRGADQVSAGQVVDVRLARGDIAARVEEVHDD